MHPQSLGVEALEHVLANVLRTARSNLYAPPSVAPAAPLETAAAVLAAIAARLAQARTAVDDDIVSALE